MFLTVLVSEQLRDDMSAKTARKYLKSGSLPSQCKAGCQILIFAIIVAEISSK